MDGIEATMATDSKRLTGVEDTAKVLLQQNSTIIALLRQLTGGGGAATAAPLEDLVREGEFCFPFLFLLLSSHTFVN